MTNPPPPVTTPRYAVAVTLPGEAPFWFPPRDVPYYGNKQGANATAHTARILYKDDYPDVTVEVVPVVVTVTVADAGRGEVDRG